MKNANNKKEKLRWKNKINNFKRKWNKLISLKNMITFLM